MSNPKVFEYAKEIGLTPLALMDKIREWHLPVKSHMAELSPELLATIREKMNEDAKPADAAAKKPVARKKAAAPAAKAPVKTAVVKSSTVKTKAAPAASEVDATKPKAATVVRRKAKSADDAAHDHAPDATHESHEGVHEHDEHETPVVEATPATTPAAVAETSAAVESHAVPVVEAKATDKKVESPVEKVIEKVVEKAADKPVEKAPEKTTAAKPPVVETKTPPTAAVASTAPAAAGAAPAGAKPTGATAPAATLGAKPGTPGVAPGAQHNKFVPRKKEVAIGQSGVSSEAAPAVVRRNIVGRMDLSRVQAPPGSRPPREGGGFGSRPAGSGGPNAGGGFAARPKGNLRAGFIAAAPPPEVPGVSAEDFKKRDEKRRLKSGGVEAAMTARETEAEPPAFDAAEFRKREMVFQPKKKKVGMSRPAMQTVKTTAAAHKRILKVEGVMKVGDAAMEMGLKATDLIKALMKNGVMATINTPLDFDTLALIVPDFGWEAKSVLKTDKDLVVETAFGDLDAEPVTRPPVVTVMGHVDHGKTSLLDAIRKANVAAGEAGGITQHIGAYQVTLEDGSKITFLDTPGHAAFTAMRARGANVTDIAVIVVAADDGVMPQTAEAISHAKAAGVPMIVAVNKIDKPGANPDKIKQQLTEYEVVPEEWGGSTIFVNVSAIKKTGIPELLEQIKLLAEMAELKANPKRSAKGTVIESKLEKGRGPVATVLVQDGTLEVGQHVVAGQQTGRVRSIMNDRGEVLKSATPGMPVQILGLSGTPQAGDKFDIVRDEKAAEEVAAYRKSEADKAAQVTGKASLEEIFAKATRGDVKDLAVIMKADVAGSLEALQGMFAKLSTPEVKVKIIHAAVGGISESDVLLAATTKGIIIGFNVRPDGVAAQAAKSKGVELRTYSIVYELIDDMKRLMSGLLTPDVVEKVMGRAEVRNTFTVPKIGTIAGCFVADGKIQRNNMVRLIRDGKIVYEGKLGSLKRFKDDAKEVATGFECGIGIENFNDVKVGDVIEAFTKEEVARSIDGAEAQP